MQIHFQASSRLRHNGKRSTPFSRAERGGSATPASLREGIAGRASPRAMLGIDAAAGVILRALPLIFSIALGEHDPPCTSRLATVYEQWRLLPRCVLFSPVHA